MVAQTSMGHDVFLPWKSVHRLTRLWIRPVGLMPQDYIHPQLIYDYMWSDINEAVLQYASLEAMQFRISLLCLLRHIMWEYPVLGPVFMSKVNLENEYMHIYILMEDTPLLAFIVPTHPAYTYALISFHLSLTMR